MKRRIAFAAAGCSVILALTLAGGCASTKKAPAPPVAGPQAEDEGGLAAVKVTEFILGVGDTVEISVYRNDDLKKTVKIDPTGRIIFPLIGDVQASGKSVFSLRDELTQKLSRFVVSPQVSIVISGVQSQKVLVVGEVKNPGVFVLDQDISILDAVTKAGGVTNDAKPENSVLVRKKAGASEITIVDLKKMMKGGDLTANVNLQAGDIIYLPAKKIASVARYFAYLNQVLSPIVNLETGIVLWPQVKNAFQGENTETPTTIPAK